MLPGNTSEERTAQPRHYIPWVHKQSGHKGEECSRVYRQLLYDNYQTDLHRS